jgi:hypothetical protein
VADSRRQLSRRAWPAVAALFAALLMALAAPTLLWAYHLSAGGALLERGLVWPEPRQVDSLPAAADAAALRDAQAQLEQAARWRSGHPHAYRLGAYAALAAGDWQRAALLLDEARAHAPAHPLIAWEAGLAYERLWQATPQDVGLRDRMLDAWRSGGFDADTLRVRAAEARLGGRNEEARRWDARAELLVRTSP